MKWYFSNFLENVGKNHDTIPLHGNQKQIGAQLGPPCSAGGNVNQFNPSEKV